tara:strand:+ start:89 stop:433 length:345 start_codon:yes stop_codon:yes gene_type:complete
VHKQCLLKTIESRNSIHCSICAQPIQNVAVKSRRRPALWVVGFTIMLSTTIICSSLGALLFLALAVDDRNHAAFVDLLICCASCVFLATFASHFLQKLLHDHELTVSQNVYQFT